MSHVEITNIPEDIYHQLQERARANGKSVSQQAADYLRQAIVEGAAEAKLLADIREEREAQNVYITEDGSRDVSKRPVGYGRPQADRSIPESRG